MQNFKDYLQQILEQVPEEKLEEVKEATQSLTALYDTTNEKLEGLTADLNDTRAKATEFELERDATKKAFFDHFMKATGFDEDSSPKPEKPKTLEDIFGTKF